MKIYVAYLFEYHCRNGTNIKIDGYLCESAFSGWATLKINVKYVNNYGQTLT